MDIRLRPYTPQDVAACMGVWNEVLEEGVAFPGTELMTEESMAEYIAQQSAAICAVDESDSVLGLYVIHPNNIGRCSHVANASYCVGSAWRGRGAGRLLVPHSLQEAKRLGFCGMQYNAVVKGNKGAIKVYMDNGFEIVGTIPGGFRLKDGSYSDMYVMYRAL